eukprot:7475573-Alexandrium_andersonii.AAC.1
MRGAGGSKSSSGLSGWGGATAPPDSPPRLAPPARAASPESCRPLDPPKTPPARRKHFWRAGCTFWGVSGGR